MRRGYVDHEKQIVFFWAQKSACTTLFTMLTAAYGERNKFYHENSLPWQDCLKVIAEKGYRSFALGRNPTPRIVSAYVNKFVEYSGKRLTHVDHLESFSRKLLKTHFEREGIEGDTLDISFEGFLRTVLQMHHMRARSSKYHLNGHWDTQVPGPMRNYKYDCLARIEDAPASLETFCALSGLAFTAEQRNKSNYAERSDTYLGDLPAYAFGDRSFHTASFLNKANRRLINKLFEVDFETLGYAPTP